MNKVFLFLLLVFVITSLSVYAETTGTINFTYVNATSGLSGYTVRGCNATADCYGYTCFRDYDNVSDVAGSKGWCNATIVTSCFHNIGSDIYSYASGSNFCTGGSGNTTYVTCTNGVWSNELTCSSGTCSPAGSTGSCSTSSSSTTTSSGSSGTVTSGAISIKVFPADFSMMRNESVVKRVTLRNIGNKTLYNITPAVSGLSWYLVNVTKIAQLTKDKEVNFSINFTPPTDAEVKVYTVIVNVNTHDSLVSASKTLKITINVSEQTVQDEVVPDLNNYTEILASLAANITDLESRGANITDVLDVYASARKKINDAKTFIESKDYSTAIQLLNEAKLLIEEASLMVLELNNQPQQLKIDNLTIGIVAGIVIVIAVIAYLMLPPKNEKRTSLYELLQKHDNSLREKISRRFGNGRKNKTKFKPKKR